MMPTPRYTPEEAREIRRITEDTQRFLRRLQRGPWFWVPRDL